MHVVEIWRTTCARVLSYLPGAREMVHYARVGQGRRLESLLSHPVKDGAPFCEHLRALAEVRACHLVELLCSAVLQRLENVQGELHLSRRDWAKVRLDQSRRLGRVFARRKVCEIHTFIQPTQPIRANQINSWVM